MSFFQYHVFFCCNQRAEGETCCNAHGASKLRDYAKDRIKAAKCDGPGKVRINSAGCLGRCDDGPVRVVYPGETWYTYVDKEDIDEIVDQHLLKGQIVERLKI